MGVDVKTNVVHSGPAMRKCGPSVLLGVGRPHSICKAQEATPHSSSASVTSKTEDEGEPREVMTLKSEYETQSDPVAQSTRSAGDHGVPLWIGVPPSAAGACSASRRRRNRRRASTSEANILLKRSTQ